ncbi:hypothetical protein JZ751_017846 [Albula glossodonta]|uniref:Uncharacterized protein n=1 Tax=Albula glossodonta TaxID=121402 RepID=A0A8T2PPJ1_9TELE|nr:hypothetical protein JZ751_017846 [Albula glossodonta]
MLQSPSADLSRLYREQKRPNCEPTRVHPHPHPPPPPPPYSAGRGVETLAESSKLSQYGNVTGFTRYPAEMELESTDGAVQFTCGKQSCTQKTRQISMGDVYGSLYVLPSQRRRLHQAACASCKSHAEYSSNANIAQLSVLS